MGIPFHVAPLLRNLYSRCSTTLARLGASDRLGRISTSSKSSLGSLSIRMFNHSTADDGLKMNPECILAANTPVLFRMEQDSILVR